MKAKKTTLLSALICVAGILAEIIFRDVLSKSIMGVWLSVLLAAVILVLVYFVYDGVYSYVEAKQELETVHHTEREQKLYHVLNEQLQFEKAIIQEVNALKQANDKLTEEIAAQKKVNDKLSEQVTAQRQTGEQLLEQMSAQKLSDEQLSEQVTAQKQISERLSEQMTEQSEVSELILEQVTTQSGKTVQDQNTAPMTEQVQQVSASIDQEQFDQVVALVNDHTMKAAKIIARYVNQNATEMKELLNENHKEEYIILKDLEGNQRTLLAIEEQKKQH